MKYLQIERGHTPLKYKKSRNRKICITILISVLTATSILIHFNIGRWDNWLMLSGLK